MRRNTKSLIAFSTLLAILIINTPVITKAVPSGYVTQQYPVYTAATPLKFDSASNPWFISNGFNQFSVTSGAIAATYPVPIGTLGDNPAFSLDSGNVLWYAFSGDSAWVTLVKYSYLSAQATPYQFNPALPACTVDNLFIDAGGRIWIVAHSIDTSVQFYAVMFNPSSTSFSLFSAPEPIGGNQLNPSGRVPVVQDASKNIWFPGPGSSLYRVDGAGVYTKYTLKGNNQLYPVAFDVDAAGSAWTSIANTYLDMSLTTVLKLVPPITVSNTGVNQEIVNYVLSNGEYLWVSAGDYTLRVYDSTGVSFVDTMTFSVPITYLGLAPDGSVWVYGQASFGQSPSYLFFRIHKLTTSELYTAATPSGTLGAGGWYRSIVTVNFQVSGGTAQSIRYTIDGVPGVINAGSGSVTIRNEGVHTVTYYAAPPSGPAETQKQFEIRIDMTPPVVAITSPNNGDTITKPQAVTPTYTVSDNLDAHPNVVVDPPVIDENMPDGPLTVVVTATDEAGNVGRDTVGVVVLSNTPPVTNIVYNGGAGSNDWYVTPVDVTIATIEGYVTKISYSVDGGRYKSVASSEATFTVSTQGKHTIQFYSTSYSGVNEGVQTATLNMDWTAPTLTITSPTRGQAFLPTSQIDLRYTVVDNVDATPVVTVQPSQFPSPLPLGDLAITVTATDAAGNTAVKSVIVKIQETIAKTPYAIKTGAKNILLSGKTGVKDVDAAIDVAVALIDKSLDPRYWVDDSHLRDDHGIKVFIYEGLAAGSLQTSATLYEKAIPAQQSLIDQLTKQHKDATQQSARLAAMQAVIPVMRQAAAMLAQADEGLAKVALDEAKALTPPTKGNSFATALKNAGKEYNDGLADEAAGNPTKSIIDFKQSWVHSRQAAHIQGGDNNWNGGVDVSYDGDDHDDNNSHDNDKHK